MSTTDRDKVKRLVGFKFERHPQHNLSEERLVFIEQMIQSQVQKLLA